MRSQNTDAEWLDMRSTVVAEALMRVGNHTGRQDLMERGVAAVRSCFALLTENRTQANLVFPVTQVAGRAQVRQAVHDVDSTTLTQSASLFLHSFLSSSLALTSADAEVSAREELSKE